MHTGDWWWKQQKDHPPGATIIPILLSNDKTIMSLSHGNQTLWPIYISIGNLDSKTRHYQTWSGVLLLGSISIIHKWSEDGNNKNKNLKAKIYHLVLKTMLQRKYLLLTSNRSDTIILDIALWDTYKNGIEIRCTNGFKQCCYPIFAGLMVDYKEQVLITRIKSNRLYSICHVLPKKR